MRTVELGFKAFDTHELLCHAVARRIGAYADAGLDVRLRDTTFIGADHLPATTLQVACGTALLACVRGEPSHRVVLVATDRPMFWLYARSGLDSIGDLAGKSIAGYPALAPPWHFERMLLRAHDLDPDSTHHLDARDDLARLGLLRSGDVDAALISSAVPPVILAELGLRPVADVGQHVRVPSTGLTASPRLLEEDPDVVRAMVGAHRLALTAIQEQPSIAAPAVASILDPMTRDTRAVQALLAIVRERFGADGTIPLAIAEAAAARIAADIGAKRPPPVADLYGRVLAA